MAQQDYLLKCLNTTCTELCTLPSLQQVLDLQVLVSEAMQKSSELKTTLLEHPDSNGSMRQVETWHNGQPEKRNTQKFNNFSSC